MQCPTCKGEQRVESALIGMIDCPDCGGTGVLYTQAEIDELKHEIKARDKLIKKLAQIEGFVSVRNGTTKPCLRCGYFATFECLRPDGMTCIDGVIEWVRRQVEEEAGR
jgi:ssDNA-binding Zn-finger/Zn-ribbon topoisomerase 1